MDKEIVVCLYNEYSSTIKLNELPEYLQYELYLKVMLTKRIQAQKLHIVSFNLYEISPQILGEPLNTGSSFVVAWGFTSNT